MNATLPQPARSWPGLKLVVVIGMLFGIQLGLVFWLGRRTEGPRKPERRGRIETAGVRTPDFPTAASPTLLAVPSRQGASGEAWLRKAPLTNEAPEWTGQPNASLARPPLSLANDLSNLSILANSPLRSVAGSTKPSPEVVNVFTAPPPDSSFSIEGDLAGRRLSGVPVLESPSADSLLSNTVVQIMVNAEGWVAVPPAVLPGGSSGSSTADDYAMNLANGLRFKALPRRSSSGGGLPAAGLTSGRLVFHWRTMPMPATNTPPASP